MKKIFPTKNNIKYMSPLYTFAAFEYSNSVRTGIVGRERSDKKYEREESKAQC